MHSFVHELWILESLFTEEIEPTATVCRGGGKAFAKEGVTAASSEVFNRY